MKYTVIITAYNEQRYIEECLASVVKQNRKDLEVLLIDDASTDETTALCHAYAQAHPFIRLLRHSRREGIAAARNHGIREATGDYLLFLDGDDMLAWGAIAEIDAVLSEIPADILHFHMLTLSSGEKNGLTYDTLKEGSYTGGEKEAHILQMLRIGNRSLFSANTYVYKRELIAQQRFRQINLYDGMLFTLEALLCAGTVYWCNRYLYTHRRHLSSMTLDHYVDKCTPLVQFCEEWERLLANLHAPEEYSVLLRRYLFERELICGLRMESAIVNEYTRNPYPDAARERVRMLLDSAAAMRLLPEEASCEGDMLTVYRACREKNEAWFHDWMRDFFLKREQAVYEKHGYVCPNEYCMNYLRQVIYIVNPKVACSSLKAALSGYDYEDEYAVHKLQRHQTDMVSRNILSPLEKQFFIFTFVREPFRRLVSNYESKFKSDLRMGFNQYLTYRGGIMAKDEGFEAFVRKVCEIPDEFADRHFRSQYGLVYDKKGNQIPDFVGHLETIDEEYEEIRKKYRLGKLKRLNQTDSRDKKDWRSYYTVETANMVYEKYRKDFEAFGYEASYRELMEYLTNGGEQKQ